MAKESHTPKAWLGPGASQELHRDFVLGTCCLWSSIQQKGKGEMAKHAIPQVTAGGDSYPEASVHSGHRCSEAFRSFASERKDAAGCFVLGKLVCLETVKAARKLPVFSRESKQQHLLFIMIA